MAASLLSFVDHQRQFANRIRQYEADLKDGPAPMGGAPSSDYEHACTPDLTGHHVGQSRARLTLVKALRSAPTPHRGADGLDQGSATPGPRQYVMARHAAALTTRFAADKEDCHAGMHAVSQHRGDDRRTAPRLPRVRHHRDTRARWSVDDDAARVDAVGRVWICGRPYRARRYDRQDAGATRV